MNKKYIHINALIPKWKRKRCPEHRKSLMDFDGFEWFKCSEAGCGLEWNGVDYRDTGVAMYFSRQDQTRAHTPDSDFALRSRHATLLQADDETE